MWLYKEMSNCGLCLLCCLAVEGFTSGRPLHNSFWFFGSFCTFESHVIVSILILLLTNHYVLYAFHFFLLIHYAFFSYVHYNINKQNKNLLAIINKSSSRFAVLLNIVFYKCCLLIFIRQVGVMCNVHNAQHKVTHISAAFKFWFGYLIMWLTVTNSW